MGFQGAWRSLSAEFRDGGQKGLSLVEILVVSGIVSILTVIISSVLVNTSKQVRSVEATSDYNALVGLFQSTFNNGDSCIRALNSTTTPVTFQKPSATGLDINVPAKVKIGGTDFKSGDKYQGIKITQLAFRRAEPVNEAKGQYKLNLFLEVDRSLGATTAVGGNIKQETFELIVEAQPASGSTNLAVQACYGMFQNLWSRRTGSNDIYVKGLRVGINSESPAFELDVSGTVRGGAFIYNSDSRLKENIRDLDSPLDRVLALHGVKFDWKSEVASSLKQDQLGLIAQEVEKVFPEAVVTDPRTGLKSVAYANLISPLIEALKEQQRLLNRQQEEIRQIRKQLQAR